MGGDSYVKALEAQIERLGADLINTRIELRIEINTLTDKVSELAKDASAKNVTISNLEEKIKALEAPPRIMLGGRRPDPEKVPSSGTWSFRAAT